MKAYPKYRNQRPVAFLTLLPLEALFAQPLRTYLATSSAKKREDLRLDQEPKAAVRYAITQQKHR